MNITINIPTNVAVALADVDTMVMVCSHERSGTHFLMNSLASCTKYVNNPWLNYDLVPFGGVVNFYSEDSVRDFVAKFSRFKVNGSSLGMASIVKSHFPVSMVRCALNEGLKVAYIYRNPVDTLISFWKLIHGLGWFEGPKVATPLEFARHFPCGQTQRYQMRNCESYFDRWALHVTDAVRVANTTDKVVLVSYESLVGNYASSMETLVAKLGVARVNDPAYPSRGENVISGAKMDVSGEALQDLRRFCAQRAKLYPDLPAAIFDHIEQAADRL